MDEVLGPINQVFFTIKPQEGIVATSFKAGDKFYIGGDKLLPLEKYEARHPAGDHRAENETDSYPSPNHHRALQNRNVQGVDHEVDLCAEAEVELVEPAEELREVGEALATEEEEDLEEGLEEVALVPVEGPEEVQIQILQGLVALVGEGHSRARLALRRICLSFREGYPNIFC